MTEGTIKPVKYVRIGSREVPIEAGCACCERIELALASCVRVDQEQGFTDPEQAVGRANIGAVTAVEAAAAAPVQSVNGETGAVILSASDVGADPTGTAQDLISQSAVRFDVAQSLTGEQKTQARENIGISASASKITTIIADGNFTIGEASQWFRVLLVGAGGGGGSGGSSSGTATGGAGGGGGAAIEATFTRAQILTAYGTGIVPVSIGAGGAGGAGVTNAGNASGNNGSAGGATAFGSLVTAYGGGGGEKGGYGGAVNVGGAGGSQRAPGGTAAYAGAWGAAGGGNGTTPGTVPAYGCGAGGAGCSNYGFSYAGGYAHFGGQSGASGGGIDNTNVARPGADGGPRFGETAGASGGTLEGSAGSNGAAPANGSVSGQGGGGGAAGKTMAAGAGGAGGLGSGAGGGGASSLTYASGAGGNGGNGYVVVEEW